MQYRLRTLLIVLAVLPPFIGGVVHYQRSRDKRLWMELDVAKQNRDQLLTTWRHTNDLVVSGQVGAGEEVAVQQQYLTARTDLEKAVVAVRARYGGKDEDLKRALKERQAMK